jgi:acetolactate synthase-1/2/3 large subunit
MLCAARRPMIYAGGGVNSAGASQELADLAQRLKAPVAMSLMGIGAVPRNFEFCTGLIGMHGTVASNRAVQKADLLIAAGSRFSDRVTSRADHFARAAKILHLDIDPAEINKNIPSDFFVIGDIKKILEAILKKLPLSARPVWNHEIEGLKKRDARHPPGRGRGLYPRFIIEKTAEQFDPGAIVVTDVGQHQMWAARYYPVSKPRSFISSGGLGAMGFGLGAAVGAKLANPGRPVVLFTGDGSFRMNSPEMGTLSAHKIPLLIVLMNNHGLGMVRQWQKLFCHANFSETGLGQTPDFPALAEAYGIRGLRAKTQEEFTAALNSAARSVAEGNSVLIEAVIDKDEMVLPMVPGGKPVDEQIF